MSPFAGAGIKTAANPTDFPVDMVPVTPNDNDDLTKVAAGLYVEQGGAVAFISVAGASRIVNVGDGSYLFCGVTRVLSTGTTATGIHAMVVT